MRPFIRRLSVRLFTFYSPFILFLRGLPAEANDEFFRAIIYAADHNLSPIRLVRVFAPGRYSANGVSPSDSDGTE